MQNFTLQLFELMQLLKQKVLLTLKQEKQK